ncbi:MAG: 7TM-DISM domain-containing protein [Bacteroidota bacterium]
MKLFFLFSLCCASLFAYAQRAVCNIGRFSFESGVITVLNKPWELYWNKFYDPKDFREGLVPAPDLLATPSSWNDLVVNGRKCGSYGYCTYRLLLTDLPATALMLDIYSMQTASRVFVNGNMVAEVGRPGSGKETSVPVNRDVQVILPVADSIEIIVQASNFHHRKGGFVHPFEVGTPDAITKKHTLFYLLDAVESAALSIIGFFLLALYVFRRKDLSVLYFSLFCITLSLRPVISVNYLLAWLMPGISWAFMLKLEYLGVIFPCLFMTLFIKKLFPAQLPLFIVKSFLILFVVMAVITVLFPPSVFSWLVPLLLVLIPAGICFFVYAIVKAVIAKVEGANYAGIGVIVLFISLILKVLSYAGIIPAMHVVITALDIGFIFMMSLILGSRFSLQFVKVETLQQELEQQKGILEEKNKSITDSITYARRIQSSLMPSAKYIERVLRKLNRN